MESMASGASSLDSAGSSDGALNLERDSGGYGSVGSPVGGPECRSDFDDLQTQYQLLRHKHADAVRRCDHVMKDLEYYRNQHMAAMNQLEATSQENNAIRGKYTDLINDKQRMEREVQALAKEVSELHCQNQEGLVTDPNSTDAMNQHYLSTFQKYKDLKDEYDTLRKRYDDVIASHSSAVNKLELAQEEVARMQKDYEALIQERNSTLRERNGLKQQCTAAIHQWDIALRERNEYREALAKVSQQHEDAVKEINQAMVLRMKANKDIKRLTEERNAAMQEYSLIMGERDTVHKEMEKLSDDLSQAYAKITHLENENKQLLEEKKAASYQIETLQREISSALHDRDEALKECNELRQKFGDYSEGASRDRKNRMELHSYNNDRGVINKEAEKESNPREYSKREKERMDNLDQANVELDKLRKIVDTLQSELDEALQEAEVSKRRRDWAFSERDKIVLERESIRTLCDKLQKERDRVISDLANALRDSDLLKKQRNEVSKELKDLKEKLESVDHTLRSNQYRPRVHDSTIDSDSDWEVVTIHLDLGRLRVDSERDLGVVLIGGRDNPNYPNDSGVYIAQVAPGSVLENKFRVNDCILRINNVDCTAVSTRMIMETIRSCNSGTATLVVRRRRVGRRSLRTTQLPVGSVPHGITLDIGIYIAKISPGSLAAKDGYLAVGDRVLNVNSKPMEGVNSSHEAMSILNDTSNDVITITTLKILPASTMSTEAIPLETSFNSEKQKMVNSCSQTEQERMMLKATSEDYDRRYIASNFGDRSVYKVSKSLSSDKSSGISHAWDNFREKIDLVRGRRSSKDREEKKKRHRNSSSPNTFEQEQDAIAKLDSVIESYHQKKSSNGVLKRSKRRGAAGSAAPDTSTTSNADKPEKNGGTWPKARIGPPIENGTGTILHSRKAKERPGLPLSVLLNGPPKYEGGYSRIPSTPHPAAAAASGGFPSSIGLSGNNRHTVYKAMESSSPIPSFGKSRQKFFVSGQMKDPDKSKADYEGPEHRLGSALTPSETSIEFYGGKPAQKNGRLDKYSPFADSSPQVEILHSRLHSQLYGSPMGPSSGSGGPRQPLASTFFPPFHMHPHPHHQSSLSSRYPSPPSLPSAQSGESIGLPETRSSYCFEPPYSPIQPQPGFGHMHTPSVDLNYHKSRGMNHPMMLPYDAAPSYTHGYESGTFPRKKENQRFRIPSNPSVTSKSSIGKFSSGSIEKTSERGSPMPTFSVEVINPGTGVNSGTGTIRGSSINKRSSMPDYCFTQPRPAPNELRKIHIDKSQKPLGIQISCHKNGGVFVSTVTEHSLASQVGLQIGDQLLEVCGINMRKCAHYQLAANILRQWGSSRTLLVQYSPDKYSELEASASSSSSEDNGQKAGSHSGSLTPCNSPEAARKSVIEPLESSEPERDSSALNTMRKSDRERDREREREIRASASLDVRSTQERDRDLRNSTSLDINIRKPELRSSATLGAMRNSVTLDGLRNNATLTRSQTSHIASTLQRQNATVRSPTQEEQSRSKTPPPSEPRYLFIETRKCANLGISLVGGNGVGIFVHSVQPGCLAEDAGLRTGDRILEYNGVDLRQATAEQAALELARPADKVTLIAQYVPDRYNEVKDKPGDSFYVKAMFDRTGDIGDSMQLRFNKDDILYVDNTMFNGTPGYWRAWLIDPTGIRQAYGIIPSKFKVEEEMLLRRSLGDLETDTGRRGTTSARRSFFRRKKHQRSSSRDSKELSHLTGVSMSWYSDSGTLNEENVPATYQRVERVDYPAMRPILLIGPLNDCIINKLMQDYSCEFIRCTPESMNCSQSTLDQGIRDLIYVDYRKKGSYFECTTVQAVKDICDKNAHAVLDINISAIERLHRHQIYPIVLLIKFKNTKQIKEIKDTRFPSDKGSGKAAKEMYELALKAESDYRHFVNAIIPANVSVSFISNQVKATVDDEQKKPLWVPRGHT